MSGRLPGDESRALRRFAALATVLLAGLFAACADKAPDPLWPEPPPPTLAEPIGQELEPPPDDGSRSVGAMPAEGASAETSDDSGTDTGSQTD